MLSKSQSSSVEGGVSLSSCTWNAVATTAVMLLQYWLLLLLLLIDLCATLR
jgi:hypothetical protein